MLNSDVGSYYFKGGDWELHKCVVPVLMNKHYIVVIVGLGRIGSSFAKEFSRFASCFNHKKNTLEKLILIDGADVEESDVENQFFLKQDIGWNKAASLAMILTSQFNSYQNTGFTIGNNVVICSYGHHIENSSEFSKILKKVAGRSYDDHTDMYLLLNCTNSIMDTMIESFEELDNAVLLQPDSCSIHLRARFLGNEVNTKRQGRMKKEQISSVLALTISHLLMANVCNIMVNNLINTEELIIGMDGLSTGRENKLIEAENIEKVSFPCKEKTVIVCVGTGGTGGNFCKEVVMFLRKRENLVLLMIDGDRVEEKNCIRQPFGYSDIMQNKADVLKRGLLLDYPELEGRIFSYPSYLDSVQDLKSAISQTGVKNVILIGCVDNHRARQIMHSYYTMENTILYLDSANEFSVGEVVVSIKKDGEECSPLRAFYYPDVLTDNSPSASELSCGLVNISSPQHQVTNLVAAHTMMTILDKMLTQELVCGGIVYFDSFEYFSRLQPVGKEFLIRENFL